MSNPAPSATPDALLEHAAWVRRLARSLVVDAAEADDLVQETWLAVLERPPRGLRNPRAWLARVVRNILSHRRRADARRARRESAGLRPAPLPTTDELVTRAELQRTVLAAVLSLKEPYRTVVLLRYFDDRSCEQIARTQQLPASTVRNRLKRALLLLRGQLELSRATPGRVWIAMLALAGLDRGARGAATLTATKESLMPGAKLALAASTLALVGVGVAYLTLNGLEDRAALLTQAAQATPARRQSPDSRAEPPATVQSVQPQTPITLEERLAAVEREARRQDRRGRISSPARGPRLLGPKGLARALALTDDQKSRWKEILDRKQARHADLLATPNAEGESPAAYSKPYKEMYDQGFKEHDGAKIQAGMEKIAAWRAWMVPGTNETYGEGEQRIWAEANEAFTALLTDEQKKLAADGEYLQQFAGPLGADDGEADSKSGKPRVVRMVSVSSRADGEKK